MSHSSSLPAAVSAALAAAVFGLASASSAQIPQSEPYVAESFGFIAAGQHIAHDSAGSAPATLTTLGQIRVYHFNYVAGETIWFLGYTGGCLDLQLQVIDEATFMVVASASCSGNNGPYGACAGYGVSITIDASTALPSGAYMLWVSDVGGDETGSFSISMVRAGPPDGPMLSNATLVTDTIAPVTDADTLGFDVVQGSIVNLYLRTHGCLDLGYRVLDASGAVIVGPSTIGGNTGPYGACASNQVSFNPFALPGNPNAPAPASGRYWIVLNDSGLDETGTYDAQVQCLYSPTGCPPAAGNFTLAMTQPTGHGSLAIDVTNGTPDAPYITAFTFDATNNSTPHTGWFGGLHISFPELGGIMGLGFPFLGLLDQTGQSHFATPFPFGPFPPLWAVSVELSPGYLNLVRATPVIQVNLQ